MPNAVYNYRASITHIIFYVSDRSNVTLISIFNFHISFTWHPCNQEDTAHKSTNILKCNEQFFWQLIILCSLMTLSPLLSDTNFKIY